MRRQEGVDVQSFTLVSNDDRAGFEAFLAAEVPSRAAAGSAASAIKSPPTDVVSPPSLQYLAATYTTAGADPLFAAGVGVDVLPFWSVLDASRS